MVIFSDFLCFLVQIILVVTFVGFALFGAEDTNFCLLIS